ncbi:hypothetical protein L873DRAFT_56640 [Choiromyces venosus 120613-1]|uniref:Uncharacterized protein n=1 Tax=Choiromyces venosus 120613-1 TaxID=1336337 RepID=A0A3N4J5L9_9PEZI|nr:hypothetical protein L873DRAFT_56640 [Choiromyces venosus 120613-1]
MYDCRTQGGHFFVFQSSLPTLPCNHCSKTTSRPYRCILEKCGYLACEPCATSINASLDEFHKSRELAKANGLPLPSPPSPPSRHSPPPSAAFGEDGDDGSGVVGRPRRGTVESVVGAISSTSLGGPASSSAALGMGIIEVDDEVQDEEYAPPKRPFTRSAAMAAALAATRQASSRAKARSSTYRPRGEEGEGGG